MMFFTHFRCPAIFLIEKLAFHPHYSVPLGWLLLKSIPACPGVPISLGHVCEAASDKNKKPVKAHLSKSLSKEMPGK